MFIVVAYDIEDDRRRLRVADVMENFGVRVQRSVFECHLDPKQLEELTGRISLRIDHEADRVSYYRLCRKDHDRILLDGRGELSQDSDFFML